MRSISLIDAKSFFYIGFSGFENICSQCHTNTNITGKMCEKRHPKINTASTPGAGAPPAGEQPARHSDDLTDANS